MNAITTINPSIAAHIAVVDGKPTTTTQDIAEVFGKRHDRVMAIVRQRIAEAGEWGIHNFVDTPYTNPQNGQTYSVIRMSKKGFAFVVQKFTGKKAVEFQLAYVDEFERMEMALLAQSQPARNECLTHEQINQIRLAVKERMAHTGEKNSTVYSELFRSLGVGHTHTIYQSQFARAMDQVNNYPRSIPETNEGFFLSEFRASEFDARLRSLFDLAGLLGKRGSDIATVFQRQCLELNTLLARESMIRGGMSVEQAMRRKPADRGLALKKPVGENAYSGDF